MTRIQFMSGRYPYSFTAEEAENAIIFAKDNGISFDTITSMMDDEIREDVHDDIAPCSYAEFLCEYLRRADTDLIIM